MSSGFIPAGTLLPTTPLPSEDPTDIAWAAARAAVSSSSLTTTPSSTTVPLQPEDPRSLYEILQSNKARKQEEFEEKLKFKNQFRALDEDDVEFLDSVLDGQKRVELERRRAVEGEVERFRERQIGEDTARVGGEEGEEGEGLKWGKRKRGERGRRLAGVKVKRKGSIEEGEGKKRKVVVEGVKVGEENLVVEKVGKVGKVVEEAEVPPPKVKLNAPPAAALGLDYASDDD